MGILGSRGSVHLRSHKEITDHQPVVVLNDFKKVYFPLVAPNGSDLEAKVEVGAEIKVGTKILQRKDFYVPIYSSVSGKVAGKELRYSALVGRPVQHLILENDFKYEVEKQTFLKTAPDQATREEVVAAIKEAGIVGMGGAGFPTFIKYDNVKGLQTLIINGVECEPYLTTDYLQVQNETAYLFKGIQLLLKASGARKAIIAIKEHKPAVKFALTKFCGENPEITFKEVPDAYPMGWERTLIYQLTKKEYDKLPSEVGVVVNNAQTAIAVARALIDGIPLVKRMLTVSGNALVKNANVVVPVGALTNEIIEKMGGYAPEVEDIYLLAGGPMTSKGQMNDQFPIYGHQSGLTVLIRENREVLPCLRCGACTDSCPASIMPVTIKDAVENKNVEHMQVLDVNKCIECGLCSYVCPSNIDVTEAVKKAKLQLKLAANKKAAAAK